MSSSLRWLPFLCCAGCAQLLGLDDFTDASGGSGGSGAAGATTSTGGGGDGATGGSGAMGGGGATGGNGATGGGGGTTVSTGGAGGAGGTGGAGGSECVGNTETRSCYGGPAGTENVGVCRSGTETCNNGSWDNVCPDDIVPVAENGQTWANEDCAPNVSELADFRNAAAFGGTGEEYLTDLKILANGDVITGGTTWSATGFSFGGQTVSGTEDDGGFFMGRLQGSSAVWVRSITANARLFFGPIGTHVYVAGSASNFTTNPTALGGSVTVPAGQNFVARYDAATGLPTHVLTGTYFYGGAVDPSNGTGFCGHFITTTPPALAVVRCYQPSGVSFVQRFEKPIGPASSVNIGGLYVDGSNVIVVGRLSATTTFGPKTLTVAAGQSDAFVLKISNNAVNPAFLDALQFLVNGTATATRIAVNGTNMYIGGSFTGVLPNPLGGQSVTQGGQDAYLARIDYQPASFLKLWAKGFGSSGNDNVIAMTVNSLGSVIASFDAAGKVDFGGGPIGLVTGDYPMAAFDNIGTHLWSRLPDVFAYAFDTAPGLVAVAGSYGGGAAFSGQAPFGSTMAFPAPGIADVYLAKLEKIPF